jgi:uncharacterized Zn-finger protein
MVGKFLKALSMNQPSTDLLTSVTPPPEVIHVADHRVVCDGGGGALGHPRVFLEMGEGTEVTCPYCDRLFVLDGGGH